MRPYVAPVFPRVSSTLTSLAGVRAAGVAAGIKASGRPDVALLVLGEAVPAAGVFTQNAFAAAPVRLCRAHLARSGGRVRAIVVNAGNANACTGAAGEEAAAAMARAVATRVGCPEHEVLVASTGVIGVPLPMDRVLSGIEAAFAELSGDVEAGRRFLAAIQTTDAFEKEACEALPGEGQVVGVAKGAGMIAPNMATMLAFVGTDRPASASALAALAPTLAEQSFNAVYVDGHSSTNDSMILFATGTVPEGGAPAEGAVPSFAAPMTAVARRLAWLIARDGEGSTKVTTVSVRGAASGEAAHAVVREVAASALVRTALFGNDPNWGRFVSQVGNSAHVRSVAGLRCSVQGTVVFERGEPTRFDRAALSAAMAVEDVALLIELGEGAGAADLLVSDLGYRYVEVNAEYTT